MRKPNWNAIIFTPLGKGGEGGIDRAMDELRRTFRITPPAGLRVRFITTRGRGSVVLSPLFLALAMASTLVLHLIDRVDVAHINLAAGGSCC
jgi:hypothetical protein